MKKLLLHIGTGKTGSTTLQNALYSLRKEDKLDNIIYPRLLGKIHHNELCTLVMPHDRIRRDIRSKYRIEDSSYKDFVSNLKSKLEDETYSAENAVISGEYFCGFSKDEVSDFYSLLTAVGFEKIKIVLYYREVCSLYLSQIQQRIKGSSRFANPYTYKFNYREIYQRWSSVFEDVEVRSFSNETLKESDVTVDFIDVINRYFGAKITPPENVKKSNESLSVAGMLLQHDYRSKFYSNEDNVLYGDSNQLVKLINKVERIIDYKNKPTLKPEVRKAILYNNKEQLLWLKGELGIDFGISDDFEFNKVEQKFNFKLDEVINVSDQDRVAKEEILFRLLNMLLLKYS